MPTRLACCRRLVHLCPVLLARGGAVMDLEQTVRRMPAAPLGRKGVCLGLFRAAQSSRA
ncbi:hypothetical protein ANDA3_4020 [plant metagenome]|uniref:Uncharacterized protein n=2 Tax=root TaxID=1 RepID=A0A1C3K301_9BURK|nr:hypothetical protein ODI_01445 [Orrella dioscoreae]SOE51963.1 hypothetical protein ODI_R3820 [Orrella dioscoreae]